MQSLYNAFTISDAERTGRIDKLIENEEQNMQNLNASGKTSKAKKRPANVLEEDEPYVPSPSSLGTIIKCVLVVFMKVYFYQEFTEYITQTDNTSLLLAGNKSQAGVIASSLNANFNRSNEEISKMNNNVESLIGLLAKKYKEEEDKK